MKETNKLFLVAFLLLAPQALWSQTGQWPVRVPRITQDYACHNCTSPGRGFHAGVDITHALTDCSSNQVPVYPVMSGKVVRTVRGCAQGDRTCGRFFGNHVLIEHRGPSDPSGPLYSLYAHLASVSVNLGDTPGTGTAVGIMGATGDVDACHVHFGMADFQPPHLAAWNYPSNPLPAMGFFGYLDVPYPADDCDKSGQGHGCPDPKDHLGFLPVRLSGTRNVLEGPGLTSKCVTRVESGQTYVRLASYVQGGQEWQFVMLPSDNGPVSDPYGNATCTTGATYGWLAEDTSPPLTGLALKVLGENLDGQGLRVRQQPSSGGTELTKVWDGQLLWSATSPASGAGCTKSWYQISVPPSRANNATTGWICGDYLEFQGGQCVVPTSAGLVWDEKCGTPPPNPEAPQVSTQTASNVAQQSATLNLTVNPKGSSTQIWFDWGTSTSLGKETSPRQSVGAGATTIPASVTLGQLACDTTYYFRARASNGVGGATPGQTLSFRTDACGGGGSPGTQELITNGTFESGNTGWIAQNSFYIDTQPCPYSGSRYAFLAQASGTWADNLIGTLDQVITIPATATAVELSYRYSIQTNDTSTQPKDVLSVWIYNSSGSNALGLLETYSNLDARNGCGSSFYTRDTFNLLQYKGQTVRLRFFGTTDSRAGTPTVFRIDTVSVVATVPQASAPEATTDAADQVTSSSARLNMTVDPNGAETTVWFDLEAGDSSPDDDTEPVVIGGGSQPQSASFGAFGLECGTLYYFRAHASNSQGSDSGSVRSFTTSACAGGPPGADTDPAQSVTQTSASLTADVDPNGLATQAWFAWGTTPSLGQETPRESVGSGTGNVDFTQTLSGLACGTTYYFQNRASNAAGEDFGSILSFDTLPCGSGGPPAQGFFLDFRRQGCSGGEPAVLLWWTAPAGIDDMFTVRRSDGAYTATVDASQGGMAHLVSSLIPGETYSFHVEGTLNGNSVQTNAVTVPVISDECRLPVGAGDLPHLPLVWAGTPFCSGGAASVPVHWTAVGGASSYTLTRFDNVAGQLTPFPGLTGTSLIDGGLVPGAAYEYLLEAAGVGGARRTNLISVFVPSGICGEPSVPGPFSAQVSAPVCVEGKGAMTLSWTTASGAASRPRTYWSDDGFASGVGTTVNSSRILDGLRPGALIKLMVQAESAATPGRYRSVILSQYIPLDICGGGTLPPAVTTAAATYIQDRQALARASVTPNAGSSIAYIEWGTSPSFGSVTPVRNAGDGYRSASLAETLTGLACNTTYYFRGRAANPVGDATPGTTLEFTTKPCAASPPVVTVTATDPSASEQPLASGEFLIQRSGSIAADLAVTYSVGGTATVGQDHTLAGGTVVIPAGAASRTLTVFPLDDAVTEVDETVVVTLQAQPHYQVGSPASATVTVASNEVPGSGGCGSVLVQQPRDEFGGCDASDVGIQWWVAENFRLSGTKTVSCLEVLGYHWPENDPPPASLFDVVLHRAGNDGAPGAVVYEDRGIQARREKTGVVSFGLEEWRFTLELTSPVELAAGDFFAEISGAAPTGGSFCWIGGQRDPVAGVNGMAFRNSSQWSTGTWDLAFKVFEPATGLFVDGFESGTTEKWQHWP